MISNGCDEKDISVTNQGVETGLGHLRAAAADRTTGV